MGEVEIEAHPLGISWVVKEPMRRACHALVDEGRVWLVDPVDDDEALERARELGEPAAVLQLLDRHNRDCTELAARLGIPHLKVPDSIPDSPFEAIPAVRVPLWRETAVWWPRHSALVVAEVVGTSELFTVGQGPAGMHPFLRALPPGSLRGRRPEHLLVGHGRNLHGGEATSGLETAYSRARRDIPRVIGALPRVLRG